MSPKPDDDADDRMTDTLDGAPVPRAPATPRSIRAASNSLSSVPVVFPEGYEFIEWLGEGGMGLVAKARDIGLNRGVAIKLIRPEISDRKSVRSAFVREAGAATMLGRSVDDGFMRYTSASAVITLETTRRSSTPTLYNS